MNSMVEEGIFYSIHQESLPVKHRLPKIHFLFLSRSERRNLNSNSIRRLRIISESKEEQRSRSRRKREAEFFSPANINRYFKKKLSIGCHNKKTPFRGDYFSVIKFFERLIFEYFLPIFRDAFSSRENIFPFFEKFFLAILGNITESWSFIFFFKDAN